MPIYDYVCHHCGHRFEVIHGVHADGPRTCPVCGGGPVRKAISAPSIHFKGSGWAKKDRGSAARKAASASETAPAATGGDGGSSADGAASGTTPKASTERPAAEKSSSSSSDPAATVKDRD
jgi:putative FmdB family regulatory protein